MTTTSSIYATAPSARGEPFGRIRSGVSGLSLLLAAGALVGVPSAGVAQALPQGGSVVSGGVAISTPSANQMTIRQSTDKGIVNWNTYNVGAGARVEYQQPSATAATLNRVTGNTTSTIAGQISANGRVYLVNPNGIQITPTGTVKASGFVASTNDITDDDFKAGRNVFRGTGSSASVINQGKIKVRPGGFVALAGGRVVNEGTIDAPRGKVGLGAGEHVTLDMEGDGFLSVTVPSKNADKLDALVKHSGKIRANGGLVEMRAATSADVARAAVHVTGDVEATSVRSSRGGLSFGGAPGAAGKVVIDGGAGGSVKVSGKLDASSKTGAGGSVQVRGREVALSGTVAVSGKTRGGTVAVQGTEKVESSGRITAKGTTGGDVTATGADIALKGATIDVSGQSGGGRVRVGGDYQGQGDLPRAKVVSIDAASSISADAGETGDGGRVIVWSDERTDYAGTITARG